MNVIAVISMWESLFWLTLGWGLTVLAIILYDIIFEKSEGGD